MARAAQRPSRTCRASQAARPGLLSPHSVMRGEGRATCSGRPAVAWVLAIIVRASTRQGELPVQACRVDARAVRRPRRVGVR